MAKQHSLSPELISLAALENQLPPFEPAQPAPAEIADLPHTITAADQGITPRTDDSFYADHWGINE